MANQNDDDAKDRICNYAPQSIKRTCYYSVFRGCHPTADVGYSSNVGRHNTRSNGTQQT